MEKCNHPNDHNEILQTNFKFMNNLGLYLKCCFSINKLIYVHLHNISLNTYNLYPSRYATEADNEWFSLAAYVFFANYTNLNKCFRNYLDACTRICLPKFVITFDLCISHIWHIKSLISACFLKAIHFTPGYKTETIQWSVQKLIDVSCFYRALILNRCHYLAA